MKYIANIITSARIFLSITLLFTEPCAAVFYIIYITAGLTDMIDGTIARKTHSVSTFGSRLDTIADFVFVVCCVVKLWSFLILPRWVYFWIAGIFVIKVTAAIINLKKKRKDIFPHSILNKNTGAVLFLLPLTLTLVDVLYPAIAVCAVASVAAVGDFFSRDSSPADSNKTKH